MNIFNGRGKIQIIRHPRRDAIIKISHGLNI